MLDNAENLKKALIQCRYNCRKYNDLVLRLVEDWPPASKILDRLTSLTYTTLTSPLKAHQLLVTSIQSGLNAYEQLLTVDQTNYFDAVLSYTDHERLAAFINGLINALETPLFMKEFCDKVDTQPISRDIQRRHIYNRLLDQELREYIRRNHHEDTILCHNHAVSV